MVSTEVQCDRVMRDHSVLGCFVKRIVMCFVSCSVFLFAHSLACAQSQQTLNDTGGKSTTGRLVAASNDVLTFAGGNEKLNLPFSEVTELKFDNEEIAIDPAATQYRMQLVDGSQITFQSLEISKGEISGVLFNDLSMSINRSNVHALRLKSHAGEPDQDEKLNQYLAQTPKLADELVIYRNEQFQSLEGVIGELVEGKIGFETEDQAVSVSLKKLEGLLFYHASGREFADPICKLNLTDGSMLNVRAISADEDSALTVTLVSGSRVEIEREKIGSLDFSLGRDVFLSELKPATTDWQPLIANDVLEGYLRKLKLPRLNRAYNGSSLSLEFHPDPQLPFLAERRSFDRGIAMTGGTRLSYAIGGRYKRLSGWVGFDPNANPAGNVTLVVRGDGQKMLEKQMLAREMENPIELKLDIENVQRLTFQVDYHDGRAIGDNIHLVDIKASK